MSPNQFSIILQKEIQTSPKKVCQQGERLVNNSESKFSCQKDTCAYTTHYPMTYNRFMSEKINSRASKLTFKSTKVQITQARIIAEQTVEVSLVTIPISKLIIFIMTESPQNTSQKQENLNLFTNYSQYSSYCPRTRFPSQMQSSQISDFKNAELFKLNQRLNDFEQKINTIFLEPQVMQDHQTNESTVVERKKGSSFYGNSLQTMKSTVQQSGNTFNNYMLTKKSPNKNLQEEFQEYLEFKEFLKAKNLAFQCNESLSDLYSYYLNNNVQEQLKQHEMLKLTAQKIIIKK